MDKFALSLLVLQLNIAARATHHTVYVDVNGDKCETQTGTFLCPFFNVDTALHGVTTSSQIKVAPGSYEFSFDQDYFKVIKTTIACDDGPVIFKNSSIFSNALEVMVTGQVTFDSTRISTKDFEYSPTKGSDSLILRGDLNSTAYVRAEVLRVSNADVRHHGSVGKLTSVTGSSTSVTVANSNFTSLATLVGTSVTCEHCFFAANSSLFAFNRLLLNHTDVVGQNSFGQPATITIDHSDVTVTQMVLRQVRSVNINKSILRTTTINLSGVGSSAFFRTPSEVSIQDSIITNHLDRHAHTLTFSMVTQVILDNVEFRSLHLLNSTDPLIEVDGDNSLVSLSSLRISDCKAGSVLLGRGGDYVVKDTALRASDYSGSPHTSPVKFNETLRGSTSVVFQNSTVACADTASTAIEVDIASIDLLNLKLDNLNVDGCSTPECGSSEVSLSGVTNCVKCPLGKYAEYGEVGKCIPCWPGSFGKKPGVCQNCPAGTYSDSVGNCLSCPDGTYTNVDGRTSCDTCGRGYEWVSETHCEMCGEDTYQLSDGGRCFDCTTWFETSGWGEGECSANFGRIMIVVGSILGGSILLTAIAFALSRKQNTARRQRQKLSSGNTPHSNFNNNYSGAPFHQMPNGCAPPNGAEVHYVVHQYLPGNAAPSSHVPAEKGSQELSP